MSYHMYTTEGIILRRQATGEANALLYILTRDLGLIVASAQAVRVASSKLRPAIQEYTYGLFACVKGKSGWKATNAVEKQNFFFSSPQYARRVLARAASVLQQMIPGEDPHPEIFEVVVSGFRSLGTTVSEDLAAFECLLMFRILYLLGYVEKNADTENFLSDTSDWDSLLSEMKKEQARIVDLINKGMKASQL